MRGLTPLSMQTKSNKLLIIALLLLVSFCVYIIYLTNFKNGEVDSTLSSRELASLLRNHETDLQDDTLKKIAVESLEREVKSEELKANIIRFTGRFWVGSLIFTAYGFWLVGSTAKGAQRGQQSSDSITNNRMQ